MVPFKTVSIKCRANSGVACTDENSIFVWLAMNTLFQFVFETTKKMNNNIKQKQKINYKIYYINTALNITTTIKQNIATLSAVSTLRVGCCVGLMVGSCVGSSKLPGKHVDVKEPRFIS